MAAQAQSSLDPLLPSYVGPSDTAPGVNDGYEELPSYAQIPELASDPQRAIQRETTEIEYKLGKANKPLLVLTLLGDKAFSRDIAAFLEGTPIKGKIAIEADNPKSIAALVLTVKGSFITGGASFDGYTFVFLEHDHTIWSREAELQVDQEILVNHTFPFSVDLPKEVSMIEKLGHEPKMFRLPQTFNKRFAHTTIKYDILVKIVRRGLFRSDDTLSVPFAFIPVTEPPPFPPLRRLAYEEGTPLPGPKVDPDGWHLQNPVVIEGALFDGRSARVNCKLFFSKPLSYTRGSVIPLFITLDSDDKHALDLLSAPKSIAVRVRRRIKYTPTPHKLFEAENWRTEIEHSQRAVWWPATDNAGDSSHETSRQLNGELHLKPSMAPTSAMGMFKVEYSVVLLPFTSPGFTAGNEPGHVLLEQAITVVTAYASGPKPRASTPASYEPDAKYKADELQTGGEYSVGFY